MSALPLILFAYNRPELVAKTLASLQDCRGVGQTHLWVFLDGPKSDKDARLVKQVKEVVQSANRFKSIEVKEAKANMGLAKSTILGLSEVFSRYEAAIIMEDDLEVAPCFLEYMNHYMQQYKEESKVGSVQAFSFPVGETSEVYFLKKFTSLGWGTWRRVWEKMCWDVEVLIGQVENKKEFDFYGSYPFYEQLLQQKKGEIDSWAVRMYASLYNQNLLSMYPAKSLVKHIGYAKGTHYAGGRTVFDGEIEASNFVAQSPEITESEEMVEKWMKFYRNNRPKRFHKLVFYGLVLLGMRKQGNAFLAKTAQSLPE